MDWKFKSPETVSKPVESKECTVDIVIEALKEKYKGVVDEKVIVKMVYDVMIKHLAEKRLSLDEVLKKYENIPRANEIINEILSMAK